MPQFNIHWKGRPHRHLPCIRVASQSHGNIEGRSRAHIAAQDVFKLPIGPAFEKSRQQQRIRACKRRRGSRVSFGFHISSRRTSGRAKRKLFKGTVEDIMEPTVTYTGKVNRASKCMSAARQIADRKRLEDNNDGSRRSNSWIDGETALPGSTHKALGGSMPSRPSIYLRTRLYDRRLPTRKVRRLTKSTLSQTKQSEEWQGPSSRSQTSTPMILPSRRKLSMRISLSSTASTVGPFGKVSNMLHRTSSQQKALKVFTRELERHLVAQEAFRNAGLDKSSSSSSTMSAHSIMEFKPYSADFRAAGLAVTSKEQRGLDLPNWRIFNPSPAAITDIPQSRVVSAIIVEDSLKEKESLNRSTSGTSAICTDTASRDSIVSVFASMDGASPSREATTPYRQRVATRKTLPWLRDAEPTNGFHSKAGNSANEDVSSSRAITLTPMTTIIDFSPELERCMSGRIKTENKASRPRTADIKWLDREHDPSAIIRAPNEQSNEPTSLPSTPSHAKQGIGHIVDSKQGRVSPVTILSKNSGVDFSQLRTDHIFRDIVRNAKVCTAPAKTTIQCIGSPIKVSSSKICQLRQHVVEDGLNDHIDVAPSKTTSVKTTKPNLPRTSAFFVGPYTQPSTPFGSFRSLRIPLEHSRSSEEHRQKNNATGKEASRPQPKLASPARSPPPPPMAPSSLTSTVSPILTPACIPRHYDFNTPSVFEETIAKSHSPGKWSKHDRASASLTATRPSHQYNCDPVKRKPHSQYHPPRPRLRKSSTTNQSALKSGIVSQSQTTIYTDRSVTYSKDVFKGLQIALAAACDEDMDAWITEISGCRVRRFLADLRIFEGLGANALVDEAIRTARRRRKKMEVYRARVGTNDAEMATGPCPVGGGDTSAMKETWNGQPRDLEMGVDPSGSCLSARQKALVDEMVRRKEARKGGWGRAAVGRKGPLDENAAK